MDPTTPYREGKPLEAIIAPDRRRRRALLLIVTGMIAGAGLWVLGGTLVERVSFACPPVRADAKEAYVIAATRSSTTLGKATPSPLSRLERARRAGLEGDAAEVRRLLEAKVRAGHGEEDEARLARAACAQERDRECVDDIRAKYP